MDDVLLKRQAERFRFLATDAANFVADWDVHDPVAAAILNLMHAQSDLSFAAAVAAGEMHGCGVPSSVFPSSASSMRAIDAALDARRAAVDALVRTLELHPRAGFR